MLYYSQKGTDNLQDQLSHPPPPPPPPILNKSNITTTGMIRRSQKIKKHIPISIKLISISYC